MRGHEQFERFVRSGLAQYGVQVDEVELRVMRAAEEAYGPLRDALLAADLSDVRPELGLDPSRAPDERAFDPGYGRGLR
jgi:hypothetical protein